MDQLEKAHRYMDQLEKARSLFLENEAKILSYHI